MVNFGYTRVPTAAAAVQALLRNPGARWIAGGTNLVDLMKKGVETPDKLVDIRHLPLADVRREGSGLHIGALALNSTVASHQLVRKHQPLLSRALEAGASQQIRNMATVGGNMMQRTRCPYFYNTDLPCNKRQPGTGCGALKGVNRMHAIFGASEQCIAVHPSDMCIALAALGATVLVTGPKGDRRIPFLDFHRLPGDTPQADNTLAKGELITALEIPDNSFGGRVQYLKVRDRASYAFALVSVAAALDIRGGVIREARLAMGGVAHKPWRLAETEEFLAGKEAGEATFKQAAALAMKGARGYGHNDFKLQLAPATLVEALKGAAGNQ